MLLRKLLRTAWKYKAQFLSMIVMVAIGIGVFVGFNMEWYSLLKDTSSFMQETVYADYRIYDDGGFTEEDIAAIKELDGVEKASRVLSVNVDVKNSENSLALFVAEDYVVSTMYVVEGADYDAASEGFWLSDKYAAANGIALGDTLDIVCYGAELSGEVVGLVKSSEFMICVSGSDQLMPDYTSFGFAYAAPAKIRAAVGFTFYPQINLVSELGREDIETDVEEALERTVLVLGKSEHTAYAAAESEVEEGQTMVSVLPVLFLLIGVLTMVTTMHRITANEKTQIGTLKALGFRNARILRHYTAYGFFIGLVGAVIGIGLGYGIASIVINPNGMQGTYFDLPDWGLFAPWWTWVVLVCVVAFLTLISFLSVKKMLKGTAAEALRPYVPKKVKPLALEKTAVWNRIPFGTKWNLRDVFRNKTRTLMTLIGIVGCMILLVGGLGMRDTMTGFLDLIDGEILNYETRVNLFESASTEDVESLRERAQADTCSVSSVKADGEPVSLEVYGFYGDPKVRFVDGNNERISLSDDGIYLCLRLSDGYAVGDGFTFAPYGSDRSYTAVVAGFIRSVTSECVVMTESYADALGLQYTPSVLYTDLTAAELTSSGGEGGFFSTQPKSMIMDSYDGFMEIMNTMVLVLLVAAVVLGVVVLYNLGLMSYTERYRELATLKVVGFGNRHIGRILISQNVWLTVAGIAVGLPAGVGVLHLLLTLLATEYELKLILGALTYCVSILLTFGVSLVVGLFVARKNKKINMVEALKCSE